MLLFLDLIATYSFALIGSKIALERNYEIWLVFACGYLTAMGGGILRDVLTGVLPVAFVNPWYLIVSIAGIITTMQLHFNS